MLKLYNDLMLSRSFLTFCLRRGSKSSDIRLLPAQSVFPPTRRKRLFSRWVETAVPLAEMSMEAIAEFRPSGLALPK